MGNIFITYGISLVTWNGSEIFITLDKLCAIPIAAPLRAPPIIASEIISPVFVIFSPFVNPPFAEKSFRRPLPLGSNIASTMAFVCSDRTFEIAPYPNAAPMPVIGAIDITAPDTAPPAAALTTSFQSLTHPADLTCCIILTAPPINAPIPAPMSIDVKKCPVGSE